MQETGSADTVRTALSIAPKSHGAEAMPMSLTEGRARGDVLEAVLYGLVTPIVLVTMCSDILFMNAAAERLILASDGLMADANGLRAVSAAETRLLRALISGVAQTPAAHGCDRSELFRVSRRYGRERLQVRVSPIPAQADGQPRRQLPIAAVFVIDPQSRPGLDERALVKLYGLTPSEAKVSVAACRGLSGKEICRELQISYNTLKTHLRHIYSKTCTRHQSDLVRLLASGLALGGCGG